MEDVGRLLLLDMLLGNADRLPLPQLGWRGNPSNVLLGAPGAELLLTPTWPQVDGHWLQHLDCC